jgi:hypothetical protein
MTSEADIDFAIERVSTVVRALRKSPVART